MTNEVYQTLNKDFYIPRKPNFKGRIRCYKKINLINTI